NVVQKFEQYYPGQNIFFVDTSKTRRLNDQPKFKYIQVVDEIVVPINFEDRNSSTAIKNICNGNFDNLLVHGLSPIKAYICLTMAKDISFKSYWIFYGGDLYGWLHRIGKYRLYDKNNWWQRCKSQISFLIKVLRNAVVFKRNLCHINEEFVQR